MSRSFDSTSLTTLPSMAMVPAEISSSPASMRSSVDLPHPDGPTSTMNSPSLMSNPMPWMTLVLPKLFSMSLNDTDAMTDSRCWSLALHRAGGESADHVALECVIDRRGRQRVDEAHRHQQLPRRIVGGEKVAERDAERDLAVVGQEQECVEVFIPR